MLKAISQIKTALSAKGLGAYLDWYLFKDNRIYATDFRITASVPFTSDINRLVPGDELEALLSRLPTDFKFTLGEDSITLRAGRLHGSIRTMPTDTVQMTMPEHDWIDPPDGLVQALKMARPFVAEAAAQPYSTCACLRTGCVLATTNIALAMIDCPGLVTPNDMLLPYWTVDFIIKANGKLVKMILAEHYAAFLWDTGLWLRTQLIIGSFPPAVVTLLNEPQDTPIVIDAQWREAYQIVTGLSEGIITIESNKIIGGRGHARVEHGIETPIDVTTPVHFRPTYLLPVIERASSWNPGAYPKPVPFIGPGIRGLIVGRSA